VNICGNITSFGVLSSFVELIKYNKKNLINQRQTTWVGDIFSDRALTYHAKTLV
jgi:hypothetical protein